MDIYRGAYGILIPSEEVLNRRKFEWFARLSEKEVLESDTIIGNFLLLSVSPEQQGFLEPLDPIVNKKIEKTFVGFWRTPQQDVYGLKPNFLGDNLQKVEYPRR